MIRRIAKREIVENLGRAGDYVIGNTIAVDGGVVYANAGLEIAG